jgi:hypothetical protein
MVPHAFRIAILRHLCSFAIVVAIDFKGCLSPRSGTFVECVNAPGCSDPSHELIIVTRAAELMELQSGEARWRYCVGSVRRISCNEWMMN